uniref:PWWP domain-containing protein 2A n=1 Tax=Schistocephalus solidus TaxID=70667 RepID=A0A0X3NQ63_SCHSO
MAVSGVFKVKDEVSSSWQPGELFPGQSQCHLRRTIGRTQPCPTLASALKRLFASFAPDVNEQRVFGTPQWPPPVGPDSCLPMKTAPCSIERYSYKVDGQPSQLTVFQPGSKRTNQNLSHRFPRVLRPREFVCRKCKKSFPLEDPKPLSSSLTLASSDTQSTRVLRSPSSEIIRQSTTASNVITVLPNAFEIQHVTPPIIPKLESCFKSKETVSGSDADNGSTVENKLSSRRKRDHKRSSRSPSQPKKRRDADTDPAAVVSVEPSIDSTPELQNKVISPKPLSHHLDVLESGLSPVTLRKDRIKAQYQSSTRTQVATPAGRRHNLSRHVSTDLSKKSRKPGRPRFILGSPNGESLNGSLSDIKNSNAPIKAKDASSLSNTKESGASESPKSNQSRNGVNPAPKIPPPASDDGIQRPVVTRENNLVSSTSVPEVPPTSPRLTSNSASGRRRSGCYEKPKNRWIRAERIRDTEEAGKSPTSTPLSALTEKRRKPADPLDVSVVSSSKQKASTAASPSSPQSEAVLPLCTLLPSEAVTANTEVIVPPPEHPSMPDYQVVFKPSQESTFIPPIKIKINRNVGQLKGRQKVGQPDADGFEMKLVSESSPKIECVKDLPTSSDTDDRPKTKPDRMLPLSVPKQSLGVSNAGRRFVRRFQLPDGGSVFRLGDIVWCKLSGWPFWPARITSIAKEESTCTACVRWFAWDQVSYMACDKLWPFLEHYDKKLDRRKKRGAYKQAVDQALEAARSREQELQTKAENAGEDSGSDDDGSGWVEEDVDAKSVLCTDEPVADNEDTEPQHPLPAQSPTTDSEPVAPVEGPARQSSRGRRSSNKMCGRKPRSSCPVSQSSDAEPDPNPATQKTSQLSIEHSEADSFTQSTEMLRTLESLPLTPPLSTSADTPSKFLRLEELCERSREPSALATLKTIQDPLDVVLRSSVSQIADDPSYLNFLSAGDSSTSSRCISSIPTQSQVALSSTVPRVDEEVGFSYTRLLKSTLEVLNSEEESEGEDAGRLIIDSGSMHTSRTPVADTVTIPSNASHRSNCTFSSPIADASFLSAESNANAPGSMGFSDTLQPPPQSVSAVINCNHLIQNNPFPLPPPRIIPYTAMETDASWT